MKQFSVDMSGMWPVNSHSQIAVCYRYDGASARLDEGSQVNTLQDPTRK